MNNFWDERYSTDEYAYGTEPNAFFRKSIDELKPGKMLLPGDGEGRNAVYAASLGWDVRAIDQSFVAKEKALKLAKLNDVKIHYDVGLLSDIQLPEKEYELIGLVFIHFPPEERIKFHKDIIRALKPGGRIIMEAFHKDQINNNTGGPPVYELLFDVDDLKSDFAGHTIQYLEHQKTMLDEGPFHQGEADVVRMIAIKN